MLDSIGYRPTKGYRLCLQMTSSLTKPPRSTEDFDPINNILKLVLKIHAFSITLFWPQPLPGPACS